MLRTLLHWRTRYYLTKGMQLVCVVFVVIALIFAWLLFPQLPDTDALKKVAGSVTETNEYFIIQPTTYAAGVSDVSETAIIFYPGGAVPAKAYLYNWSLISEAEDVTVFIPKMPLNLAFLNSDAAADIQAEHPEYNAWILAGHSLGGAMACRYVQQHPLEVDGLILQASYCDTSIEDYSKPVLSLIGSRDGVLADNSEQHKTNLPVQTRFITIAGMNHAQFGSYGTQRGDKRSLISNDAATQTVNQEIHSWLISRLAQ